jgi:plastocyanin
MKKLYVSLIILSLFTLFANATVHVINVSNNVFTPNTLTVTVGDTVVWNWLAGTHTTTSTAVPSGAATWNAPIDASHLSFSYQVAVEGTYNYHCVFHSGMTGTFTAEAVGVPEFSSSQSFNWSISENNLTVTLNLNAPSSLHVRLYSMLGSDVKALASLENFHGSFNETWSLAELRKGIYFLEVSANNRKVVRKIMVE